MTELESAVPKRGTPKKRKPSRLPQIALSVRQPFAELILLGKKKFEYRRMVTHKRERVLLYAAKKTIDATAPWTRVGCESGTLPVGVIGSVEIVACEGEPGDYRWKLARPKRLRTPLKPKGRPQPVFFAPF